MVIQLGIVRLRIQLVYHICYCNDQTFDIDNIEVVFECRHKLLFHKCLFKICVLKIFTFVKQTFNESLDKMKCINMIDNCKAHLPVQYDSNIEFIRQR